MLQPCKSCAGKGHRVSICEVCGGSKRDHRWGYDSPCISCGPDGTQIYHCTICEGKGEYSLEEYRQRIKVAEEQKAALIERLNQQTLRSEQVARTTTGRARFRPNLGFVLFVFASLLVAGMFATQKDPDKGAVRKPAAPLTDAQRTALEARNLKSNLQLRLNYELSCIRSDRLWQANFTKMIKDPRVSETSRNAYRRMYDERARDIVEHQPRADELKRELSNLR